MIVTIPAQQIACVKSSIGFYIFWYAKDPCAPRTMQWLCAMCNFYKALDVESVEDGNNFSIDVPSSVAPCLSEMIQKYIFAEIDEMGDCDFEWLCTMTDIYQQLCNAKNTKEDTDDFERSKIDDDAEADGQEHKRMTMPEYEQMDSDQMSMGDEALNDEDFVDLNNPEEELF